MCCVDGRSCAEKIKCEETWTIRDWAVAKIRIRIKSHWATFKGHEVKTPCALHIYAICITYSYQMFQYEKALTIREWAAVWTRLVLLKVTGWPWMAIGSHFHSRMTLSGHFHCIAHLHLPIFLSHKHEKAVGNSSWVIAQTNFDLYGYRMTLKGHWVKISLHCTFSSTHFPPYSKWKGSDN